MIQPKVKVTGQQKVLANLNKEIKGIKNRTLDGLLAGGLIILRESNEHVPVEHGFLRASGYARKAKDNRQAVEIGYTSRYAVFVHESVEEILRGKPRQSGIGVYWGPKGHSQFLLRAVTSKQDDVLKAVRLRARVKR